MQLLEFIFTLRISIDDFQRRLVASKLSNGKLSNYCHAVFERPRLKYLVQTISENSNKTPYINDCVKRNRYRPIIIMRKRDFNRTNTYQIKRQNTIQKKNALSQIYVILSSFDKIYFSMKYCKDYTFNLALCKLALSDLGLVFPFM